MGYSDCRRAASQREVELQDSWDQCRAVLEDQVASLRKQAALLEHELSSAREDSKDVQRQLRSKVYSLWEGLIGWEAIFGGGGGGDLPYSYNISFTMALWFCRKRNCFPWPRQ